MQCPEKSVGYARVSTNEQTTINQIDVFKKHGVKIMFCDEGISGSKAPMERAEYRAMIKYLKEHPEYKTIIIYEMSRLGRSFQNSINTFLDLEKEGITVWSLTEEWTHNGDPMSRNLMLSIVSWMNEAELKRLSARTKLGMDRVRKYGSKSGKPIGKPRKEPNREIVMQMVADKKKWKFIADTLHMEVSTLFRYRQQWKRDDLGRGK